ncbi:MAG: tetratricopeptide repeat protein [Nitrospirota bacterium]|jgi:tetratricopeptide (TPR) repeat protein
MGKKAAILVVILAAGLGFGYFFGIAKNKKEIKTEDVVAAAGGHMPAPEDAIKDFKRRIAANPKDAEAMARLGDLYFENSRFDEAIAEYKKAVALNPKDIDTINDLGLAYLYVGKKDEAVKELEKGSKVDPMYQRIWLSLGFAYVSNGNKDKAREAWQRAAAMDPASSVGKESKKFLEQFK